MRRLKFSLLMCCAISLMMSDYAVAATNTGIFPILAKNKKKKEAIEAKNQADSLVYQSEKALEEMKDKISEEEKASITAEIEKVKAAIATDNTEEIKASTEALQKVFYEISAKMYQQAQGQPGAEPGANEAQGEVVDED